MPKQTFFIGATHGDEPIGVRALQSLASERSDFDWTIGNPRAFALGVRYTEADLNRCAPGAARSSVYESRRAAEILARSRRYRATIDLHGTDKPTGLFAIVTNPSTENLALVRCLDVPRVVIWPAITPELKSPLSEFFPVGLEIECGPKDDPATQRELERVLARYLNSISPLPKGGHRGVAVVAAQETYEVYGELRGDPGKPLREFVECTVAGETFTPLLIGTYADAYGVTCYKLRRVAS